jgi:nucleoside-diphosphate-sugar epimerase
MNADARQLHVRSSYNLSGVSFSPGELAAEIRRHVPGFEIVYAPDFRQAIAESWPHTIDDSQARAEWGWAPRFDLARITADMLENVPLDWEEATSPLSSARARLPR